MPPEYRTGFLFWGATLPKKERRFVSRAPSRDLDAPETATCPWKSPAMPVQMPWRVSPRRIDHYRSRDRRLRAPFPIGIPLTSRSIAKSNLANPHRHHGDVHPRKVQHEPRGSSYHAQIAKVRRDVTRPIPTHRAQTRGATNGTGTPKAEPEPNPKIAPHQAPDAARRRRPPRPRRRRPKARVDAVIERNAPLERRTETRVVIVRFVPRRSLLRL